MSTVKWEISRFTRQVGCLPRYELSVCRLQNPLNFYIPTSQRDRSMDLNTWSFIFSLVGLLLGAVSAYEPIRLLFAKTSSSRQARNQRRKSENEHFAEMLSSDASALVAYVARTVLNGLFLAACIFISILLIASDKNLASHAYLCQAYYMLIGALAGRRFVSVESMLQAVSLKTESRYLKKN